MRSRAGYWIGGGLMAAAVLGVVLWVVLWGKSVLNTVDDFQRVAVPGDGLVRLEHKKYIGYFEGEDAELSVPRISFEITDRESGEPLPTNSYLTELTYTFGAHSGSAQFTVTPPRAGSYRVRTDTTSERNRLSVAFGESISKPIVRTVLGAFAIGALLGLSGIALLATTIVRRYRVRGAR